MPKRRRSPRVSAAARFFARLRARLPGARPARVSPARRLARWVSRAVLAGLAAMVAAAMVYSLLARRYDLAELGRMPERSEVYDARGNLLGRLHGENRTVIPLSQVSPLFIQALLAREDNRFYEHGGVDYLGVARAILRALKDRDVKQGASTITMQLARNSYDLTREKSLHRKLLEVAITRRIESQRTKDQILELYVNRIFFGTGIYGIERAAQSYFGKPAKDLTLDEAAMLAAIIRGPNLFSPFRHYETAVSGRNMVLDRMVAEGRLSREEAERAKKVKTKVLPEPRAPGDSWALDAVRRELERLLDEGEVEYGGLKIYTTIDPVLQKAAEESLNRELGKVEKTPGYRHQTWEQYEKLRAAGRTPGAPEYLQGAVTVIENETGAVRAIVGGRDIRHSSYNRALLARRQVGSTFKPFVYAAAVEKAGLLPTTLVNDNAIASGEIRSAEGHFSPKNSDGTFTGMRPAWWGLSKSRNTMAVRVGEIAGIENVKALAKIAGLPELESSSPQLYLGNLGASLSELTSAFTVFPNQGRRARPFLIDRIEDSAGELVYRSGVMSYEVVSPGTAWIMTAMLRRVTEGEGTAAGVRSAGYTGPAAGKTGTTDNYHDAWFTGFTPRLTCGVWVGLDDPARIVSEGYGSRLAVPVWVGVMKAALKNGYGEPSKWPAPENPVRVKICSVSGKRAGAACGRSAVEVDLPAEKVPEIVCEMHSARAVTPSNPNHREKSDASGPFLKGLRGIFR